MSKLRLPITLINLALILCYVCKNISAMRVIQHGEPTCMVGDHFFASDETYEPEGSCYQYRCERTEQGFLFPHPRTKCPYILTPDYTDCVIEPGDLSRPFPDCCEKWQCLNNKND